jgi:uncharacterized protein
MRIALIGATGRIGQRVAQEAIARGSGVTALRRGEVDIFDSVALARAVRHHDAIVSAYRAPSEALLHLLVQVAASVMQAALLAGVPRVLTVGGAGVLLVAPGVRLGDSADFPVALAPQVAAHAAAIAALRATQGVDWTCMVPAAQIGPGTRTGRYRTAVDSLVCQPGGRSVVSYEDFACSVVDELAEVRHPRQVVGVGD